MGGGGGPEACDDDGLRPCRVISRSCKRPSWFWGTFGHDSQCGIHGDLGKYVYTNYTPPPVPPHLFLVLILLLLLMWPHELRIFTAPTIVSVT